MQIQCDNDIYINAWSVLICYLFNTTSTKIQKELGFITKKLNGHFEVLNSKLQILSNLSNLSYVRQCTTVQAAYSNMEIGVFYITCRAQKLNCQNKEMFKLMDIFCRPYRANINNIHIEHEINRINFPKRRVRR